MSFDVLRLLGIGPVDRVESALHDAQTGAAGFGLEEKLDEHRVVRPRKRALRLQPAEREAARRLQRLDLQLIGIATLEPQTPTAADPQLDLGLVGEPLPDLLRVGHDAPHDLERSLDDDFLLDRVRDHAAKSTATAGCVSW